MALITLGLSGSLGYDPAAAIFRDGELVAAVEEERLIRRQHARGEMPYEAIKYCLREARIKPRDVDQVAIACAPISLFNRARWHYARRYWYAPDRSLDALFNGNRRYRRYVRRVRNLMIDMDISWARIRFVPVEHQIAHVASGYYLSGFEGRVALFSIDLKGEYATTLLGYGEDGEIHKIREFYDPDSLEGMYAAITDYLGFNMLDGAPKIMGLATFGDPDRYDLSQLVDYTGDGFRLNTRLIGTVGLRRYKYQSRGHYFSPQLVEMLGPRRAGELFQDPYVHYAAAVQKLYEKVATGLVTHYLADIIRANGKLVVSGTGAFNVKLNQRLLSLPWVKEVYVHPAAGDSGTAIGAAAWAAARQRKKIHPVPHSFFGPAYSSTWCWQACEERRERYQRGKLDDPAGTAAELLAEGHLVAWFQGRMEFGPRALGHRSILGNPDLSTMIEAINKKVKFRESWRYFSPSMLDTLAEEILGTDHPADFLTITFPVNEIWRQRFPSLAYHDGTTRAHVVREETNPRFHALLKAMEEKTGYGIVLNTSLNRPGEAMICSPEDALEMFFGSDLEYLIMEDVLVTKQQRDENEDREFEAYLKGEGRRRYVPRDDR